MRGGANGARIRLAPMNEWAVNDPQELRKVLRRLERIQKQFNDAQDDDTQISMADLIVLGGAAAIEAAAREAGHDVSVPFVPGRTDASTAQTDVDSFEVLKPMADGFRNYYVENNYRSPAEAMINKADLLTLTVPEMTALVGGMRALNANTGGASHGVFTDRPGALSNDYFVNLLSMATRWEKAPNKDGLYRAIDRDSGDVVWTATPVDLLFGSHAELRAVAEVYAENGGEQKFVDDFVAAWHKVMMLDRFELERDADDAMMANR